MIRRGQSISRAGSAVVVVKRVCNEASAWNKNVDKKDRVYLGCRVVREKIRACALASMKRISSLPWTKHACVMDTPGL
jgi:hypothetical protein